MLLSKKCSLSNILQILIEPIARFPLQEYDWIGYKCTNLSIFLPTNQIFLGKKNIFYGNLNMCSSY